MSKEESSITNDFLKSLSEPEFDPSTVPVNESKAKPLPVKKKVAAKKKATTQGFSVYEEDEQYLNQIRRRLEDLGYRVRSNSHALQIVILRSRELGLIPDSELERLHFKIDSRDGRKKKR